jgi:hypothetical protein
MAGFEGTIVIDRPIEEVFDYLAEGTNDPKFSPRVLEIAKTPEGATAVGTVFDSTVKDAGMKSTRKFEITALDRPTRIRWVERSKNLITVPRGGYDLSPVGDAQTQLTVFNEFSGHGVGKLLMPIAVRGARADAGNFAARIKSAVENG